ncbi:MAG TPA: hypothetical protein P5022_18005, partial [Candidatus Paceibacterota bacterium]|nr:hypothetical protein [Candidatus Paceibacterota bacterium]
GLLQASALRHCSNLFDLDSGAQHPPDRVEMSVAADHGYRSSNSCRGHKQIDGYDVYAAMATPIINLIQRDYSGAEPPVHAPGISSPAPL